MTLTVSPSCNFVPGVLHLAVPSPGPGWEQQLGRDGGGGGVLIVPHQPNSCQPDPDISDRKPCNPPTEEIPASQAQLVRKYGD